jgi:predicted RNase H-like HicB family nuclease
MRCTVILEPEEEGGFHIWCTALKGCHSHGDTQEEALANIQETIALYLESLQEEGPPFPADVVARQVEAAA